jgi:plasmid maintenance system antidote protein VapI
MAEKLIIELDLEKGDVKSATQAIAKAGQEAGEKAASKLTKAFKKDISSNIKGITASVAKATAAVGALGGAIGTALGVKGVQAANVQEDAINRLNTALQLSGDFSAQASQDFQAFAADLQQVTRFGDEVTLNQLALAKSFGATNEQAKEIVKTAADLSASFGIDLESATRNVAKTLGGFAGELGEVIPELKNLDQAQLQAGAGIDILAKRFAGAAGRDVQTFSGSIDQLSNAFGDLLEEVGFMITKNPQFIALVNSTTKVITNAGAALKEFAGQTNLFDAFTTTFIKFNNAIITYVIAPLELVKNLGNVVFDSLTFAIDAAIKEFAEFGLSIATFLNKIGLETDANVQKYKTLVESTTEITDEAAAKLDDSLENIFTFSVADKLSKSNEELEAFFQEQKTIAEEAAAAATEAQNIQTEQAQVTAMKLTDIFSQIGDGFTSGIGKITDTTEDVNAHLKKFSNDAGKTLQKGLGQGAGQAFAAFGAAVVNGENALEAFANSLFKSIGQQAVALGTRFILEGTAMIFSPNPQYQAQGPGLIKAGAALAAFGGAIGATAGGGQGAGGGGGAAPVSGTAQAEANTAEELATPDTENARQVGNNVEIVVQGSLVQQEELGQFITETLNDNFEKQGLTLTDARFT